MLIFLCVKLYIMDVKIGRKLGSGVMGTVFAAKIDDVDAIVKIERYNGDMTTKSPFIRQIIFNDKVATHHTDRFLSLITSSVIDDCKHTQDIPKWVVGDKKKLAKCQTRATYKKCCTLSYAPMLQYTFKQLKSSLGYKDKLIIFKYLLKSINIINIGGFFHNDIHSENIMCDSTMKKWYIIDYGAIYHKSFITNTEDYFKHMHAFSDKIQLVWAFIEDPISDHIIANDLDKDLPPYKQVVSVIKKDKMYTSIVKYIPAAPKHIQNLILVQVCACLHYDLYVRALCMDKTPIGRELMTFKQPNEAYFLKFIKNRYK